jgi:uncharacterized protein (TIGR02453 family)
MGNQYFTANTFAFLRDLRRNNDREWFKANQDRYEQKVRGPALDFIADFETPLHKISPHFIALPKKSGGSLFRIYRDVRFSKDKSPYKTHTGVQFRHEQGRDAHCPGYYLHLEPERVFIAAGIWRPDGPTLLKIRELIAADSGGWKKAVGGKRFKDTFVLEGDALKRPPRGFDADHPAIEDLKHKDFIAVAPVSEKFVSGDSFMKDITAMWRRATPLMRFLADAIEVPF